VAFIYARFDVAFTLARRTPLAGLCATASDKRRFIRTK